MEHQPTFSIVTVAWNAARVIGPTLESVQQQSCRDFEYLVVDGASTDATLQLVTDAGIAGTRIVSEPDHGIYDAMNKGIQKATGDYLVFLNAGDVFPSPDTLELVASSVGDGEELPGVLYGNTDIVDDEGHFLRHRRLQPPERLTWRSFRQGMLVCHQAFYARTDLAKANPYNMQYRFSADVDWCIRVMKAAERQGLPLRYVEAVVVNYLDGGMTVKNHRASLRERFRLMRHHYGLLPTLAMHAWFVLRSVLKK